MNNYPIKFCVYADEDDEYVNYSTSVRDELERRGYIYDERLKNIGWA